MVTVSFSFLVVVILICQRLYLMIGCQLVLDLEKIYRRPIKHFNMDIIQKVFYNCLPKTNNDLFQDKKSFLDQCKVFQTWVEHSTSKNSKIIKNTDELKNESTNLSEELGQVFSQKVVSRDAFAQQLDRFDQHSKKVLAEEFDRYQSISATVYETIVDEYEKILPKSSEVKIEIIEVKDSGHSNSHSKSPECFDLIKFLRSEIKFRPEFQKQVCSFITEKVHSLALDSQSSEKSLHIAYSTFIATFCNDYTKDVADVDLMIQRGMKNFLQLSIGVSPKLIVDVFGKILKDDHLVFYSSVFGWKKSNEISSSSFDEFSKNVQPISKSVKITGTPSLVRSFSSPINHDDCELHSLPTVKPSSDYILPSQNQTNALMSISFTTDEELEQHVCNKFGTKAHQLALDEGRDLGSMRKYFRFDLHPSQPSILPISSIGYGQPKCAHHDCTAEVKDFVKVDGKCKDIVLCDKHHAEQEGICSKLIEQLQKELEGSRMESGINFISHVLSLWKNGKANQEDETKLHSILYGVVLLDVNNNLYMLHKQVETATDSKVKEAYITRIMVYRYKAAILM
jgi:hypothetical protein